MFLTKSPLKIRARPYRAQERRGPTVQLLCITFILFFSFLPEREPGLISCPIILFCRVSHLGCHLVPQLTIGPRCSMDICVYMCVYMAYSQFADPPSPGKGGIRTGNMENLNTPMPIFFRPLIKLALLWVGGCSPANGQEGPSLGPPGPRSGPPSCP